MNILRNHKFKLIFALTTSFTLIAAIPSCNKSKYKDYSFKYWNNSTSLTDLKDYVKRVTDEGNKSYIPIEDRIVSCDINGTLYGERATYYAEYMMFPWYYEKFIDGKSAAEKQKLDNYTIQLPDENPSGTKQNITIQMKDIITRMNNYIKDDAPYKKAPNVPDFSGQVSGGYVSLATAENYMSAYLFSNKIDSEMTDTKYYGIVDEYMKKEVTKFTNMSFKDMFYKPMIELVNFLDMNDFTIYVVSNSDRLFVRELVKHNKELSQCIPTNHIIGLDVELVEDAEHKKIYRTDKLEPKTKVQAIAQEIGKKPVLSFGNSQGSDGPMHDYCLKENKYESQAYMVLADDQTREYGDNSQIIDSLKNSYTNKGYKMFSMRDDWKTIYGDNVVKK